MTASAGDAADVLARQLVAEFPIDAARVLERFDGADIAEVLSDAAPMSAARVMRALPTAIARDALGRMSLDPARAVVAALTAPWAAALLRTAPAQRFADVLAGQTARHKSAIERALSHPPQTVGALTDPLVASLPPDTDAAAAIELLRARPGMHGNRVYVADREGALRGVLPVSTIIAAPPTATLRDLMTGEVVAVSADDDTLAVASHPAWARWRSLPVVDRDNRLLGVLRFEAVQRFLLAQPTHTATSLSLPLSMAELFWLGLRGITDGLANTVAPREAGDDG